MTSYNNSSLLSGYGNTVNESAAVSSALNGASTGVTSVQISAAAAGTYSFLDAGTGDNQITLTNGVASQTIDIGSALDNDGTGVVASGSSIVANFDRLGIQLTLSGARPAQGPIPATTGYRDGDLDGSALVINEGTGGTFQVGPDDAFVHRIEINIQDMRASGAYLGMGSQSVDTLSAAQSAISNVDLAIGKVSLARGDLGAFQNRLGFNIRNSENSIENNQASESAIRDADIAFEVEEFTKSQILVQSTTAMLAQANVIPQGALSLLQ